MANVSINRGLDPEWAQGPTPETQRYGPFTTSGSLFCNSAYLNTDGAMVAAGTSNNSQLTGSTKIIYDVLGIPITNVATATAVGGGEGSISISQRYRILTDAAATTALLDQIANLTAETGTVGVNSYGSVAYPGTSSRRLLGVSTAAANNNSTQRMLQVVGLGSDQFASDILSERCELYVKIYPGNYVG